MTYERGSTNLPIFLPSPTAKSRAIFYCLFGGLGVAGLGLEFFTDDPFGSPGFLVFVLILGCFGIARRAARSGVLASEECAVAGADFRTHRLRWNDVSGFGFDGQTWASTARLTATLHSGKVVNLMDLGSSSRQHDLGADYARTLERLRIIHTHMRPEFPQ